MARTLIASKRSWTLRVTLGHEKMADYALTAMRPSWEPLLPGKWIAIIFAVGAAVTVSLALLGLTYATVFLAGMITILIVAFLSNGSV